MLNLFYNLYKNIINLYVDSYRNSKQFNNSKTLN